MHENRGRPTAILAYWGGNVAIWFNEDGSDTAVRSPFPTDQFVRFMDEMGGRGPGKEGYYWFDQKESNRVIEKLKAWCEASHQEKKASWSWMIDN